MKNFIKIICQKKFWNLKKIILFIIIFFIIFFLSFFISSQIYFEGRGPKRFSIIDYQAKVKKEILKDFESFKETLQVPVQSYLVGDLDSGTIFLKKDPQKILPIASLTKLMNAIIIVENIPLQNSILIEKEMLNAYGSTRGLEAGKKLKAIELLYPLLIESSNDAAEILAHFLGRERTVELMNKKAKEIFMEDTKFFDPSGLDPKNVSSAKDLFYLAKYLIEKRPFLLKITKGENLLLDSQIEIKKLFNKNIFFNEQNFIGGKTGYLIEAKNVGLFIFQIPNKNGENLKVVFILLGSRSLKKDTQILYQWLSNHLK